MLERRTKYKSKYKHKINDIISNWLKNYKNRPLLTLETHQFQGDASEIYKNYGCVISFEKSRDAYNYVCDRFPGSLSLEKIQTRGNDFLEISHAYQDRPSFPTILPSKPTDSLKGIQELPENSFDLIDIDPDGTPHKWINRCLELMNDKSILLVTSGIMHYSWYRPDKTMQPFNIKSNTKLKSVKRKFDHDNILIIGSCIIDEGNQKKILTLPIFVYDYWKKQSGVQRIGLWVRKKSTLSQRMDLKKYVTYDRIIKRNKIKCHFRNNMDSKQLYKIEDNWSELEIMDYICNRLEYLSKL